jgi:hypothetical protein
LARLLEFLASDSISRTSLRLQSHSRFLDVGSGIGQVVLHVQLRYALAACIGIECVPDRYDVAKQTLAQLQLQRPGGQPDQAAAAAAATATTTTTAADSRFIVPGLACALDKRLDRIRFVRGLIEEQLELVSDATHVFLFDCCFHPKTHQTLLPRLCDGPPRIVITCLTRRRIQQSCWPTPISLDEVCRRFRLLRKMPLTLAGSLSTRVAYIYQTSGNAAASA